MAVKSGSPNPLMPLIAVSGHSCAGRYHPNSGSDELRAHLVSSMMYASVIVATADWKTLLLQVG